MLNKEEIEELDDENVEVDIDTRFHLYWTCPNCNEENAEYDISPGETVKCICDNCNKQYEYYYNPF